MSRLKEIYWKTMQSRNYQGGSTPQEFRAGLEATLPNSIAQIEELAQNINAVDLFISTVANLLIAPADSITEMSHGRVPGMLELLAYHLYPQFGVSDITPVSPWQTTACADALSTLHIRKMMLDTLPTVETDNEADRLARMVRAYTTVVRGTAYPEQTAQRIMDVQGQFDAWFGAKLGLQPSRAVKMLINIMQTREAAVKAFMPAVHENMRQMTKLWRSAKRTAPRKRSASENSLLAVFKTQAAAAIFERVAALNILAPQHFPVCREQVSVDGGEPTLEEWNALIELVGLTTEYRASVTSVLDVRARPLYALPDGRLLLVDITHTLDILWERFEEAARSDQPFHDKSYQRAKANWLEEQAAAYLKRIFPEAQVYQGLSYPDPDKLAGATTELDLAVSWGPFLILVEAKAKQFRLQSQLGDVPRLRTDLQRNIEDAFQQARRAARYIEATDQPVLTEIKTGRTLTVNKTDLQRTFLLTVSQHEFARLATGLSALQDLGLFRDGEYPVAISAADLDIISQFCDGPDIFLHYIERRLYVQKNQPAVQADELDFFGAYLDTRLLPERLWGSIEGKFDRFDLSGFSERFDQWMMYQRGDLPSVPDIGLDLPAEIKRVLTKLRQLPDDDSRWIAFSLLDLPDHALNTLARSCQRLRTETLVPGQFRRAVDQTGDLVVLVVASKNNTLHLLHERVHMRVAMEMYRRKATRAVGLGIAVEQSERPFEVAVWGTGEWMPDPEMEELLAHDPTTALSPESRLPGRNQKCFCGSGKKFKQCCKSLLENNRKLTNRL